MNNKITLIILTILIANIFVHPVEAQTVNVTQELSFGEAVIIDNSDQHTIDIQADGSFTSDSEFVFLQDPLRGIIHVTALPPSTAITNITLTVQQQMQGPGEDFTISNFNIDAPSSSDINGELTIDLGARLQTSGSNQTYFPNSHFASVMELAIQF